MKTMGRAIIKSALVLSLLQYCLHQNEKSFVILASEDMIEYYPLSKL